MTQGSYWGGGTHGEGGGLGREGHRQGCFWGVPPSLALSLSLSVAMNSPIAPLNTLTHPPQAPQIPPSSPKSPLQPP